MRATVLVDNIGDEKTPGEWGLSFFIEYGDRKILLDSGASGLFAENAQKLGIPLEKTDVAVLSHAHYDHADGMGIFFEKNSRARLFLRDACRENCYKKEESRWKYIGIRKGLLEKYSDRLFFVSGDYEIEKGIWLIPHKTKNLAQIGEMEHMYQREDGRWITDSFTHEQSLVFRTGNGLVIFNSCSHGGADNIIKEVSASFGGEKVNALIGGFHLHNKTEEYVRIFSKHIRETGVKQIYTGHCTGEEAFRILRDELGDMVKQLRVGLTIEFTAP